MAKILTIKTPGRACIDITTQVENVLINCGVKHGLAHVFIQHTSASLTVQENADEDVRRDLVNWLDRIAPEHGPYSHTAEGPDDMPAHLKSAITSTSLSVPFEGGRLLTGTWQGLYLLEHRRQPHERHVVITLLPGISA
ncbi:secondary thiamine-phosphate synthase enzyme YjbQ [Hyphococcus flavus]|uniref:Secondary thiamine-phosphate synthase enzyme YjbQ n=1 Tax=Hyphococcus flavus TaxID=1866326 RepID=A0AAE9ZE60_9PROT|nr:secondary thiamine-phosphate synthase enzyme YjbQ [Hyphococcus flavus]WDI33214.1 secondary thiamine-phosphate synthase enzyme YjbQ [Hyphococcus flavus]